MLISTTISLSIIIALILFLFNRNRTNTRATEKRNRRDVLRIKQFTSQSERDVFVPTTFHTAEFLKTNKKNFQTREVIRKPVCVVDCNYSMGVIDKSDIESTRKTIKWYKKFFFPTLDVSVWNLYRLCKFETKRDISIVDFRLNVDETKFCKSIAVTILFTLLRWQLVHGP